MKPDAHPLPRPTVSAWAGLSMTQLDYLAKLEIAAPDVGDSRKRFSRNEGRLVVILGCLIRLGVSPSLLKSVADTIRKNVVTDERFDAACRGTEDYCLSIAIRSDGKSDIVAGSDPERISGFAGWMVIDARALFAERSIL